MAGTETKRIIELTEASTVQSGDFIAVDSNARGTKKVSTDALATSAALTAETNARAGADEQMSERMDGIEEQTALIQNPTKTLSGALCSFADGADMPMVACTAEIVPKQSGTGTPSPENVRPISGWSSVTIADYAVNMLTEQTNEKRPCFIKAGTQIVASAKKDGSGNAYFYYYRADGTRIDYWALSGTTGGRSWRNITPPEDVYFVAFLGSDATLSERQVALAPTIEYSETLANVTKTVNLGRTVYGGTLDVVSGVLTAYPFYPSYNGETLDGRWICDRAVYAEGTTPPTGSQVALISGTSTTYQLTPTEVNTLLGENNVWADSGDVEITYRRDISIVINNLESALNG